MAGVPMLAVSDWLLARAKVSVPLAGSLQEFFLQPQIHLCAFFFCQLSNEPGAILGLMVRVCRGSNLWLSPLRSYLLLVLHLSPRSKTTAPYGCSEDGRNVGNALMLGYLRRHNYLHRTISQWPSKFRSTGATHSYPGRVM